MARFKNAHVKLYNDKGKQVGKVTLPDSIKLGARQSTVITFDEVAQPTLQEALDLARSCRNGNGHVKVHVDAGVDMVVGGVTTKKGLIKKNELSIKCDTKSNILSEISKLGKTGQKSGKSYGDIIDDIANHLGGKKPADIDQKKEPKVGLGGARYIEWGLSALAILTDIGSWPLGLKKYQADADAAAPDAAAAPAAPAAAAAVANVANVVQQGVDQVVDQVRGRNVTWPRKGHPSVTYMKAHK